MSDLLAYKGALVATWLVGLFLAERFWPAAPLPATVACLWACLMHIA